MQHQHGTEHEQDGRPLGFYFLVAFLFFLTTFIGWNFAGLIGGVIGFIFAGIINGYALRIKFD